MQKVLRVLITAIASAACLVIALPSARADVSYYTPPAFKNKVSPIYPDAAKAAHETGTVVLKVLVGTDGKAKQYILFKSSGHKDLDDAVMTAAKASTYVPAMRGTTPTVGFFDMTFVFNLTGVAENEGSQNDLQKKLDANPKDVDTRLQLGTDYLTQKQYSQAEALFSTGTQQVPTNAKMWSYLGLSYYQDAQNTPDVTKYKPAVDAFDKALAIDPRSDTNNVAASAYFNEGFQLQQAGNNAAAYPYAQKAVALDSKQSQYYILLGEIQTSQNDYPDAITTLKKAESLDNKQNSKITSRIIADEANAELSQGDKTDGMADISRAEQANGQAPFAYIYMFSYYFKSGNRAAAIAPLQQLTQIDPTNPQWYNEMGNLYLGMNNIPSARTAFLNALKISPQSPDAQFGMAELAATTGDTATLASTMAKITPGTDPKTLAVWNGSIAIELINASQNGKSYWTDAESYATQATTEDPTNGQAWYALGVADAQQKDKKDQANAALKKAYDIFKAQNNADSMKAVNDIYKQLNGSDIAS